MSEHSEQLEFWRQIVDPTGIGMIDAMAHEIALFTGEAIDVVRQKMTTGLHDFKTLWLSQQIDPSDVQQVERFYVDQFTEAYELGNWHAGGDGEPPLDYAKAALFAKKMGFRRVLDFGSGIGTGSIALAAVGCEVHSADIARRLLAFVRHRMEQRGYAGYTIALADGERPRTDYYDLITCFDVLEHLHDQYSKLLELQSYLRTGGYLFVNIFDNSSNEDRPMHISSAGNWLALVRRTGLEPAWEYFGGRSHVLFKGRVSKLRNAIGRIVDAVQGL